VPRFLLRHLASPFGLRATLAMEHPELRCARVDLVRLSDWAALATKSCCGWEEEIAFRTDSPRAEALPITADVTPVVQWTVPTRGSIENLPLLPFSARSSAGEVEVEVEASRSIFATFLTCSGCTRRSRRAWLRVLRARGARRSRVAFEAGFG